ncbi:hypothetical protein F511_09836 [Dorcoceras hygrometricum]|uniref:Uncharacterized protein n=1 Tax=Dorcoceras hygrometricum TaxID=472368 RepID=A0A2Z7CF16_9LAMI|nr:hypothetical protein F511_09836 [Dorcoceras hygrometricum]
MLEWYPPLAECFPKHSPLVGEWIRIRTPAGSGRTKKFYRDAINTKPGASRLIAVDSSIRSTTRLEAPSSDCTRSPDEISMIGFSTSNWPEQISGDERRRAAAAHGGRRRRTAGEEGEAGGARGLWLSRSTTRLEAPSSDCTRSPDEISTIGFSTSNWPEQISGDDRRRAAAAHGEEGRGGYVLDKNEEQAEEEEQEQFWGW